ncbi:MAG: fimbrillin family protein [Methanocorpusculum sp.]|nr:fimbrillin family protein [Methanocorpusculum sp.]
MKRSKTQLLRSLAAVMLLGAGLASCSQDDIVDKQQGEPLPPGEYPLILTAGGLEAVATPAQQSAPTTRGTMEGNWDGVKSVAVMVNGKVKEYKVTPSATDNKTAKLEVIYGATPFYWESTEDLTVKAWYPYKQIEEKIDLPTTWNAEKDFEDNDWLGAVNVMSFGDQSSHTLQFNHLLSKITVNLKQSDYLSAYEQEQVNVMCKLSSNSFTFKGVSKNEDDVAGFDSESVTPADVTPMRLANPAEGAFASFQCLANPDMESIDITVTVDGTIYKATDLKPSASFKPGHTYTFDINVKAEGLEVSVNDGIAWGDDGAAGSGSVELL